MNESQDLQISELKKLDYKFYEYLAHGKEPLTYTYKEKEEAKDTQVEVNARFPKSKDGVLVDIDFDTNSSGRWIKTDKVHTYLVTPNNTWLNSSYDGSELAE